MFNVPGNLGWALPFGSLRLCGAGVAVLPGCGCRLQGPRGGATPIPDPWSVIGAGPGAARLTVEAGRVQG